MTFYQSNTLILSHTIGDVTFSIVETDITSMDVDVLVNAANESLLGGGGVDGAIHRAAGIDLYYYCRDIGGCQPGDAVRTPGFLLKPEIIHAVGPRWRDGTHHEEETLRQTIRNIFQQIHVNDKTIAIPAISCGIFAYPLEDALTIIVEETLRLATAGQNIYFVTYLAPEIARLWPIVFKKVASLPM